MRISSIKGSSFYWRDVFAACPAVILNGQWTEHVVEADDEAGAVEVLVYKNGRPRIRKGYFVTKVLHGKVEIVGRKHGDAVN